MSSSEVMKGSCSGCGMPSPPLLAVKASRSLSVSLRASLAIRCSLVVTRSVTVSSDADHSH